MSCLGVGWRARRDSNPRPKRFDLPRDVAPSARARSAPDPCRCRSRASGAAAGILPPRGFIAYAVYQSMMDSTERHRLVASSLPSDKKLVLATLHRRENIVAVGAERP